MNNQDHLPQKTFGFMLAAMVGITVTGISYTIGNKAGFGAFLLTDEVLNDIKGYDNVMEAFLLSAVWQITSFMLMLLIPKWFIYQDKSQKLWYSLFIYWLLPFVVWFSLDDPARFLAFSLIATMVWLEKILDRLA
ncbi:MAG: hypothetical protein AAB618_03440 [Patescibacteria group bacterium]